MNRMVYDWAPSSRMPAGVDPQITGELLERVQEQNGGIITPHAVVDAARPTSSPIHSAFEWDDWRAGELYRQEQARGLIRSVRVLVNVQNAETQPVRAFLNVKMTEQGSGYVAVREALTTPAYRDQILVDALAELKAWQARYKQLNELAGIFEAIEQMKLAA